MVPVSIPEATEEIKEVAKHPKVRVLKIPECRSCCQGAVAVGQHGQRSLSVSKTITPCIWGYYGFYPDAEGQPKDLTKVRSLCLLSTTVSLHHIPFVVIFNITIQIIFITLTSLMERRAMLW